MTKTRKKAAKGFLVKTPEYIIDKFCKKNPLDFAPHRIADFVQENRDKWDEEYLNRSIDEPDCYGAADGDGDPFYLKDNGSSIKREVFWHPQSDEPDMIRLAEIWSGSWLLTLFQNQYGEKDFTIGVHTGYCNTFHSVQAKKMVVQLIGEDGYNRWRQHVLSNYDAAVRYFEAQLLEHFPGELFWSVTTNESAERLMGKFPLVHMHRKVAFLIVP